MKKVVCQLLPHAVLTAAGPIPAGTAAGLIFILISYVAGPHFSLSHTLLSIMRLRRAVTTRRRHWVKKKNLFFNENTFEPR